MSPSKRALKKLRAAERSAQRVSTPFVQRAREGRRASRSLEHAQGKSASNYRAQVPLEVDELSRRGLYSGVSVARQPAKPQRSRKQAKRQRPGPNDARSLGLSYDSREANYGEVVPAK